MTCHDCNGNCKKHGKNRNGSQRYRCNACGRTFTDEDSRKPQPLGNMRIDEKQAVMALKMLLEGMSVRSVERLTGLHRDTICSLVVTVGENCKRFLEDTMQNVTVNEIQCDEIWSFVGCKEKTRQRKGHSEEFGDAYAWVGIERDTKLIVAWHLGKRSSDDCWKFVHKLYRNTNTHQRYSVFTDGYRPYQSAVPLTYRFDVDFSQIIKSFGGSSDDERRYSPAQIVSTKKTLGCGKPDLQRAGTSHVERSNLSMRMTMRRWTRLTNAHSKKWENHEAMLALYFAWYNYCRNHSTLKTTPAVANKLTDHKWSLMELLQKAAA